MLVYIYRRRVKKYHTKTLYTLSFEAENEKLRNYILSDSSFICKLRELRFRWNTHSFELTVSLRSLVCRHQSLCLITVCFMFHILVCFTATMWAIEFVSLSSLCDTGHERLSKVDEKDKLSNNVRTDCVSICGDSKCCKLTTIYPLNSFARNTTFRTHFWIS